MQQMEAQIKRLQDKLQRLIQQYQLMQKENSKLKRELEEEKSLHDLKSAQAEQLSQQVAILKYAKGEMKPDEKTMMEKRLNQYMKEIDKCITLLNE